jgi:hypothetical protein
MSDPAILHGDLQKAGRAHLEIGHRVDKLADGWVVYAQQRGPIRWRKVATFHCREALADFLVASLSTPEDHL